jgi:hypothetical protein
MKSPFCLLAAMSSLVSALAARATDDMQIYSDRLTSMSAAHVNYESN